ncbi:uncharacterized protein LACBIDRAFT_310676 [Laccaria bicolor S238N-H82]|uniref:Predicted protein n=1 Tax=Laccaria bicolor (strain S238N-H82 / ATCC MYA-4686) TaxID=486041 RepID=B0DUV5_LACBS|nr:uncharacterized protein LACBIDRAFT_310676 [Laccaria bicolor S238N-H82]EDR01678.1 predicted protein [Laccaria bicolor S238N-H82]|eukprot:XP_001887754.1 predicted protein [Laccaria bicolor S238N-H82]
MPATRQSRSASRDTLRRVSTLILPTNDAGDAARLFRMDLGVTGHTSFYRQPKR